MEMRPMAAKKEKGDAFARPVLYGKTRKPRPWGPANEERRGFLVSLFGDELRVCVAVAVDTAHGA